MNFVESALPWIQQHLHGRVLDVALRRQIDELHASRHHVTIFGNLDGTIEVRGRPVPLPYSVGIDVQYEDRDELINVFQASRLGVVATYRDAALFAVRPRGGSNKPPRAANAVAAAFDLLSADQRFLDERVGDFLEHQARVSHRPPAQRFIALAAGVVHLIFAYVGTFVGAFRSEAGPRKPGG